MVLFVDNSLFYEFFNGKDIPCPIKVYLYSLENGVMPITDAIHKGDRLEQVRVLFLRRPEGVGTREIAQLLGVSQRTARRYVIELSERGRLPVYRQGRVWKLVEGGHLNLLRIELNLDEALALYLAARMLSAYSDKHNPHMVASLSKLAEILPEAIGEHVERAAEAVSQRQPAPKYLDVLEGLIRAWASRRQVRLTYRDPISGARSKRLFDPFFIEPSFIGYSCYVYGFDHFRQANCSFKLERLERVEVLDTHFEPPDFDPYEYPRHAWGIRGGYEVVEVKVRFSKEATYRVRESDWPGVIAREEDQDGRCTLTFLVNHVLEIKSWIRGWGPECEVLAPDELRREIAAEMKAAGALYKTIRE